MKRKILVVLICMMLFTIVSTASISIKSGHIEINKESTLTNVEYVLDQKQFLNDGHSNIHRNIWMAQSFKPSMTPLTKVLLKIDKPVVIDEPLLFSIRKNLTGSELTYIPITSDEIPYYINWVEFDFPDIEVEVGETYYIIVRTNSPSSKSYRWLYKNNETEMGDPYENGKQWISFNKGQDWVLTEDEDSYIDSTFQTYSYVTNSDLYCNSNNLNWTNIEPASTVTGSFTVENIGTPLSYLDWEITNWPSWGVWTFTPSDGNRLKPEDGIVTVQLSVKAPNITNNRYSGQITIINKEDDSDYCTIDASLATPKNRDSINLQPLQLKWKILKYLPFLERILASHSFMGNIQYY